MKLGIEGEEKLAVSPARLWEALNDPKVLEKCVPGCREMVQTAPDAYRVVLELKVAAVGGSFEGAIALHDKEPPTSCRITVSGEGSLGQGAGEAHFTIVPGEGDTSCLKYAGTGEIGGLVAGVGQRVLKSVSKHLAGRFFKAMRQELEHTANGAVA
jgi:carbon monoxide dehydrogenase subunit G